MSTLARTTRAQTGRAQTTRRFFAIVRERGMAEEDWRAFVETQTGGSSLSALDDAALVQVTDALGGEEVREAKRGHRKASSKGHVRKVYALW